MLKEKVGLSSCQEQSILPFDLIVQQILVRLPLRKLVQLRCVCKPWNAVLAWGGSVAGLNFPLHHPEQQEEYWFVMQSCYNPKPVFTVCSSHDTENPPFLLPLLSDRLLSYLGGSCCPYLVRNTQEVFCGLLIASAGGLIAATVPDRKYGDFRVLVFNCLTGSVKVLPPPICPRALCYDDWLMYMSVDNEDPCRYYVMLSLMTLTIDDISHFEVFDSKAGRWKVGSRTILESSAQQVPSGDFFHYKVGDDSAQLLVYHVDRDAWSAVQVPHDEVWFRPHKHKRRLFGSFITLEGNTFEVRELQITSSQIACWVEVSRTPKPLLRSTAGGASIFAVKSEGNLFYSRSYPPAEPLVYDISKNSWYVQPLPLGTPKRDFVFVHRPRLSMFFS